MNHTGRLHKQDQVRYTKEYLLDILPHHAKWRQLFSKDHLMEGERFFFPLISSSWIDGIVYVAGPAKRHSSTCWLTPSMNTYLASIKKLCFCYSYHFQNHHE